MRTTRPGRSAARAARHLGVGVPVTLVVGLLAGAAMAQTAPWPASPPAASGGGAPWPSDPPAQAGAGGSAPWPASPPRAGMGAPPGPMGAAPMGAGPMTPVPPRAGGPAGAGGAPPCMEEFTKLQAETDKRGKAAKAGVEKKVPREELCKLFTGFATAIGNWAKYVRQNAASCGIPANVADQLKTGHANISKTAKQACAAGPVGAGPGPAAPPSLSEALGTARAPVAGSTGGGSRPSTGTFDTLTGSSLAR